MAQSNNTLIYVGDPMCSWCYGFAPEIAKAKSELAETMDFQLVLGGLRPYNTQTMADLEEFLAHHWEDVEKASGQKFNHAILKDHTFVYDTEPPSRAVRVIRKLQPESEFAFFKAVQTLFYFDNKNTSLVETYFPLVQELGIDTKLFAEEFNSDAMKAAIKEDFQYSADLGVRGFPSIVVKKGEEYFMVANGYAKGEDIVKWVKAILVDEKK